MHHYYYNYHNYFNYYNCFNYHNYDDLCNLQRRRNSVICFLQINYVSIVTRHSNIVNVENEYCFIKNYFNYYNCFNYHNYDDLCNLQRRRNSVICCLQINYVSIVTCHSNMISVENEYCFIKNSWVGFFRPMMGE